MKKSAFVALLQSAVLVGVLAISGGTTVVSAGAITHKLIINPIQVRRWDWAESSALVGNPKRELFEEYTNKIWSQAGIQVEWLDWKEVVHEDLTLLHHPDDDGHLGLGKIKYAGDPGAVSGVVNMWFVVGSNFLAVASAGSGRTAVTNGIFGDINISGRDRPDTISHEIGHILGLGHTTERHNLMATGSGRDVPSSLGDVWPDGGLDYLTPEQISIARNDRYGWLRPVPEPTSFGLVLSVGSIFVLARQRHPSKARPLLRRDQEAFGTR